MSNKYVISIMCKDRIGIIADATGLIKKLGGNLADLSQTVLHDHFTMIMIADFPQDIDADTLRSALKATEGKTSFEIGISPTTDSFEEEGGSQKNASSLYVLTASGPDRVGLVATVTGYLREKEINICDLTSRVEDGIYTMILLVELPQNTEMGRFKHSLQVAMESVALSVELRHHALFRVTNEI